MNSRHLLCLAIVTMSVACAGLDRTITYGADGEPEWRRRLASAVPLGITADSARTVMQCNGCQCRDGVDSVAYLWCDKRSDKPLVKRRWQAVINLNAERVVYEVRGFTGLLGP